MYSMIKSSEKFNKIMSKNVFPGICDILCLTCVLLSPAGLDLEDWVSLPMYIYDPSQSIDRSILTVQFKIGLSNI